MYTQYASFRYDINYKISIDDLLENKKILTIMFMLRI